MCNRRGGEEGLRNFEPSSLEAHLPIKVENTYCLRVQSEARDLPPKSRCALKPFGSKPYILYLNLEIVIRVSAVPPSVTVSFLHTYFQW